jgi:epoxyqueuosine reductase QueG
MNATKLKSTALSLGADLTGIADLALLKERFPVSPPDLLDGYHRAVSIGIGLDRAIVNEIVDGPTEAYARHYREVNERLDEIAVKLMTWMDENGHRALAVPASYVVNREDWRGAISHRAVGRLAGLGWSGKSLMLINPTYGPAFRMATILTDMNLVADSPMENRCSTCTLCTEACVAGAILDTGTKTFYEDRLDAVNLGECIEVLTEFKARPGIGAYVCGVCIRVCPYGQTRKGGGRRQEVGEDQKQQL